MDERVQAGVPFKEMLQQMGFLSATLASTTGSPVSIEKIGARDGPSASLRPCTTFGASGNT